MLSVPNSALTPIGNGQAMAETFKNDVATAAPVKTGYGTLRQGRAEVVQDHLPARGQPRCDLGAVSALLQERLEDSARRDGRRREQGRQARRGRGARRQIRLPRAESGTISRTVCESAVLRISPARDASQPPARIGSRARFHDGSRHAPPS